MNKEEKKRTPAIIVEPIKKIPHHLKSFVGFPSMSLPKKPISSVRKDNANLISQFSDTITLDTTAPSGSILINDDDTWANSTSVSLSLTYSDTTSGVLEVRYSNDGSIWTSWESANDTRLWTLEGTKYESELKLPLIFQLIVQRCVTLLSRRKNVSERISKRTQINLNRMVEFLSENPWSTRNEVGDFLGLDIDETRRLFAHTDLQQRPRKPNLKRPLEYALPEAPDNPYR